MSTPLRLNNLLRFSPLFVAAMNVTAFSQAQPSGQSGLVLEEVIVTAQKREQNLLDVPLSISAFTNDTLTDIGAAQLSDFLQTAPGVGIIDNGSGTQTIQIRGINSTFGNAPVGYYLDELPFSLIGNTQLPNVRTYDLERVEILRGPQGTLYGDGSIGGTIRILTREPNLEQFSGSIDLTGSQTEDGDTNFSAQGMINIPLQEGTAAVRLVATLEDFGGWIDNIASGVDDQNERDVDTYRGKFRWAPTDELDIVLSAWHSEQDATGEAYSLDNRTVFEPAAEYETEYDLYSATVRYSFESFDLISVTSLMDYEAKSLTYIAGVFPFTELTAQDILSEELRLTSNSDGNFRWTAGLFYRNIERDTSAVLPAFAITQDLSLESSAYAVFGEAIWTFFDGAVDLTLGLRHFEDDLEFQEVLDPALLGLIQLFDPSFTGGVEETFDSTNPRINLAYRPNDNWNLYLNVAKGFRTGQSQPGISLGLAILSGVQIPTGIDPETMWSYEAGAKGTFMDGRASIEAAVFYNDWDELQVPVTVTPQVRALVNGGSATSQGIEVAVTVAAAENLQLKFGGGYTDAEFSDDVAGINIFDGDEIPGVPETTLSASATYRWPMGSMQGFAYGGLQYASERTDTLNFATPGDSTTRIDARVGVESDAWAAYLFAENLTDEDGAINAYPFGPTGPATRMRPMTWGLQLQASF